MSYAETGVSVSFWLDACRAAKQSYRSLTISGDVRSEDVELDGEDDLDDNPTGISTGQTSTFTGNNKF